MDVQTARVESDRLNRENIIRDFARFTWRATRGLGEVPETEANVVVRRLVEVGRVSSEQGDRILQGLSYRIQNSRRSFERRIEASVRTAADRLITAAHREVSRLQGQVADLERRVEKLKKK